MAGSRLRFRAAMLAARRSKDRSALDVLLDVGDLPEGWHLRRELRYRVGFACEEEWDKRARHSKLIGAGRTFGHADTRSLLGAQAVPTVTEQDARLALAAVWTRLLPSVDTTAERTDQVEVSPPPEAGDRARALLIGSTGRVRDSRRLYVAWAEQAPMLFMMMYGSPVEVDCWDTLSALVARQRERFAHRAPQDAERLPE